MKTAAPHQIPAECTLLRTSSFGRSGFVASPPLNPDEQWSKLHMYRLASHQNASLEALAMSLDMEMIGLLMSSWPLPCWSSVQ